MAPSPEIRLDQVFLLSILGAFVMLVLALTVVMFYVINQKKALQRQRHLSVAREQQQKELLSAIITAQESERSRLAADLHDDVGILLTTSQLFIRQIPELPETTEHRQTSLDLIDQSLESIRTITSGLAPDSLIHFGLIASVTDLIAVLSASAPTIQIDFISTPNASNTFLPLPTTQALFRIIKEALTNGVKHAAADYIQLRLDCTDTFYLLEYNDNGQGTNLPGTEVVGQSSHKGLGLKSIQSRAIMLDATLKIVTQPGSGFRLSLAIPICPSN